MRGLPLDDVTVVAEAIESALDNLRGVADVRQFSAVLEVESNDYKVTVMVMTEGDHGDPVVSFRESEGEGR